jgi:hypothetical protein
LSILNTDFIRFCIQLDSRVRPLMMAVRMVAKRKEISTVFVFFQEVLSKRKIKFKLIKGDG